MGGYVNRKGFNPSWMAKTMRKLREDRGWSRPELGKRAGLRPAHIHLIENEYNSPRFENAEKIFSALGYEVRLWKVEETDETAEKREPISGGFEPQKFKGGPPDWIVKLEDRATKLDLSLTRVCAEAGIAYSTYTRWKRGTTDPFLKFKKIEDIIDKHEKELRR